MNPLSLAAVCRGRRLAGRQRGHRSHHRRGHRPEVFHPAVGAHVLTGRPVDVHRRQPLGGHRGHPGVEPVRREIEGPLHQVQQRLAVELLQMGEAGPEFAQRGEGGCRGGWRLQKLADRLPTRDGQRRVELPPPVRRRRRARDEIDQLGVPQQRQEVGSCRVGLEPGRGMGDLPQQRVAQKRLQEAGGAAGVGGIRPGEHHPVDVRFGQERGDVVRLELPPRRDLAGLHQGGQHLPLPAGVADTGQPREPGRTQLLQQRRLGRIAVRPAGCEESIQVLQEMTAKGVPRAIRAGQGIRAHHVVEIGIGIRLILPVADPGHRDGGRPPHLVAQRHQHALEPGVLRRRPFAGAGLPEIERGDRQDAVRLRAAAERGKRSEAAHVIQEVPARPVVVRRRQPRLRTDHVAEEVSPAHRPQRGVHAPHGAVVALEAALDPAEGRQDAVEGQPQRRAHAEGVVVSLQHRNGGDLEGEAPLVPRIVGAVSGSPVLGVVGRSAGTHEREAVRVVVGVEEIGQLGGCLRHGERAHHAEDDQALDPRRHDGGRDGDAETHAHPLRLVEVDHPLHARIEGQLLAAGDGGVRGLIGRRRERIRTDGQRALDILAGDGGGHDVPGMHDGDPAVGHQARLRRPTPRLLPGRHRHRGEDGRHREGRSGRRRQGWTRVGGRQRPGDPGGARGAEAIGDLPPGVGAGRRVAAGPPVLLPVVPAPGVLVRRDVQLVAVDVDRVRKDAHAQLGGSAGQREEPRLQPDGQQQQGQVAGTQGWGRRSRARCGGNRKRALEESAHGRPPGLTGPPAERREW